MIKFRRLRCSFCRKGEAEVSKLVAGPRVYICDECVAVASRMMQGRSPDDGAAATAEPTIWRKVSARVRQLLQGGGGHRVSSSSVSG